MTPDEDRQLRALGDALTVVAGWEQIVAEPAGPWRVVAGSDLAADNAATHPYQVSAAARASISAAVSHAGSLRDAIFCWTGPAQVTARLQVFGQLALVRGALENASSAIWLLTPDDQAERVLRRAQKEYAEARQVRSMLEIIGSPPEWTHETRLAELRLLAGAAGADPDRVKKKVDYQAIVEAAGAQVASGSQAAVVVWKACSAIAHGDMRGAASYLTREALGPAAGGIALNRLTANVQLTVAGTMIALATSARALELYARRARTNTWPRAGFPEAANAG